MSDKRTCGHVGWMSGCAECWKDQQNPAKDGDKSGLPSISERDRMYQPLYHLKAAVMELQVAATAERDAIQNSLLNKYVTKVAELEGELQRLKTKATQLQTERDSAVAQLDHLRAYLHR